MQIRIRTLLPLEFYLSKVESYIFINHFLISSILYEESTLINFVFLIKKDFWYAILILDFTRLNVFIIFIRVQHFNSI